jgi:hypothetical protein
MLCKFSMPGEHRVAPPGCLTHIYSRLSSSGAVPGGTLKRGRGALHLSQPRAYPTPILQIPAHGSRAYYVWRSSKEMQITCPPHFDTEMKPIDLQNGDELQYHVNGEMGDYPTGWMDKLRDRWRGYHIAQPHGHTRSERRVLVAAFGSHTPINSESHPGERPDREA